MMRYAHMEKNIMKEVVILTVPKKAGDVAWHTMQDHMGKDQGWSGGRRD